MIGNVETVSIDSEENGFWMRLTTEEGDVYSFRIQDIDLDAFYDQVKGRIGPYLQEMHEARTAAARGVTLPNYTMPTSGLFKCDPDESGGYDTSDPKHPAFHSTHADIWDSREGK